MRTSLIKQEGSQASLLDDMQTRADLYKLIQYEDYAQFDKAIYNFRLGPATGE